MTPEERVQRLTAVMAERGWNRAKLGTHLALHPAFAHALLQPRPVSIGKWVSEALEQLTGVPAADWRCDIPEGPFAWLPDAADIRMQERRDAERGWS